LKQEKEEALEKLWVVQQEKDDIRAKFEEDREKIQKEKDQLLAEKTVVREAVTRALRSVSGLAQIEEETTESQVGKLVEAIQQLQARVAELELQAVPSTPQEVRDQREETARSAVERIRALASECKKLSNRSAQTYEQPCRRPGAEDIGGTTPGGEATGIDCTSTVETAYCSGEDEEVAGAVRSSAAGHCHPEQSDGGDTETPAGAG
jgi:hypothetical protein